jgi:multiple antibiotic resistance protein
MFAALTQGHSEKLKREAAIRGTTLGMAILLLSAFAGDVLLRPSGSGLRPSGPQAPTCSPFFALDMIFASPSGLRSRSIREQEEDQYSL